MANPKNLPPSATTGPMSPRIPSLLRREPSQQELEAARQLLEHSQGAQPANHATLGGRPTLNPPPDVQQEIRGTSSSVYIHPYDALPRGGDSVLPESRAPSTVASTSVLRASLPANNVAGGQMCSNCGTTKTPLWRRSPAGAVICNACGLYYKARNQMRPVSMKRGATSTSQPEDRQRYDQGSTPSIQGGARYISADQSLDGTCPGGGRCNGTGGQDACSGCPAYNNRLSKTAQVTLRQGNPEARESTSVTSTANPAQQQGPQSTNVVIACHNCNTTITPLWRRDEAGHTICNACGLYHKLHGAHRPVQMKKPEIKRRKRVVPASSRALEASPFPSDAMSDAGSGRSDHRDSLPPSNVQTPLQDGPLTAHAETARTRPIPIDFSDAFRPARDARPPELSRKRSFSQSVRGEAEPYPHPQNKDSPPLPPPPPPEHENVNPSLPPTQRDTTEAAGLGAGNLEKASRKSELRREAEKMRQLLLEKERELAELSADEQ